jgi:hypothetical protein
MRLFPIALLALLVGGTSACENHEPVSDQAMAEETEGGDSSSEPLSTCDPLIQNCGTGMACALVANYFECAPEGSQGFGENCTHPDDCEAGLVCGAFNLEGCDSGFGCCTAFCDPAEQACGAGMLCVSLFDGAPPPGVGPVGVCVPEGA